MGRSLRAILGNLKDKASFSRAALCSSTATATVVPSSSSSPQLAVIRATTHQPWGDPPHPRHIQAILAFGRGSRLSAAALTTALVARLLSTRDASVSLKALLAVHIAASRGAFILKDQISAALLASSARGNPLNLSAFNDDATPESGALSAWVRWYARVLELLLATSRVVVDFPDTSNDTEEGRLSSIPNGDLLRELESLLEFVEAARRWPGPSAVDGKRLVQEAVRVVEEDRITAERGILIRVEEIGDRIGSMDSLESVELVYLLRRLEGYKGQTSKAGGGGGGSFLNDVRHVMTRAMEAVPRERGRIVIRERMSESARIMDRDRSPSTVPVRFGSGRWGNH